MRIFQEGDFSMTWKLIMRIVQTMVVLTSPQFRIILVEGVKELYKKAEKTENPYDDFFVDFLARLMAIDLKQVIDDEEIEDVNEYKPPKKLGD